MDPTNRYKSFTGGNTDFDLRGCLINRLFGIYQWKMRFTFFSPLSLLLLSQRKQYLENLDFYCRRRGRPQLTATILLLPAEVSLFSLVEDFKIIAYFFHSLYFFFGLPVSLGLCFDGGRGRGTFGFVTVPGKSHMSHRLFCSPCS